MEQDRRPYWTSPTGSDLPISQLLAHRAYGQRVYDRDDDTRCYDPRAGDWAIWNAGDAGAFPRGSSARSCRRERCWALEAAVAAETGLGDVPVIAPATHDTGSACRCGAYGSGQRHLPRLKGTWSLMGVESKVPIIGDRSWRWNLTNEGGVDGTFHVILKNILGTLARAGVPS